MTGPRATTVNMIRTIVFSGDRKIPTRWPTVTVGNEAWRVSHLKVDQRVKILSGITDGLFFYIPRSDLLYNVC